MRIAIAGTGTLGASLLAPLLDSSHEIVAIVADGRKTRGRRRGLVAGLGRFLGGRTTLPGCAGRLGVPLIWLDKMDEEELVPLRATQPDLLLVGGFAIILKEPLLSLPRLGCVNTHSSLLPKHRGPNPFTSVILAGDEESGVTFHTMDAGIDTGGIVAQYAFSLTGSETMLGLYRQACRVAGQHVLEVLDIVAAEDFQPKPQEAGAGNYEKKKVAADTWVDWRSSAEEIDRMVRALAPHLMPRFHYGGGVVKIARTRFEPEPVDAEPGTVLQNRPLWVATGQGKIQLTVAYGVLPIPWLWPAPWSRPGIGASLLEDKRVD